MKSKEQIHERMLQIERRDTTIMEEKYYKAYYEALEWVLGRLDIVENREV